MLTKKIEDKSPASMIKKLEFLWSIYSCCPGDHCFGPACRASKFTDHTGVKREVVRVEKDVLYIQTTWPDGSYSDEWKTSIKNWKMIWAVHKFANWKMIWAVHKFAKKVS